VLKAAEQNDPLGQFLLAGCYYLGKGTEKDYEKALRYMSASAEQDFGYAFHDLAIFCYMGHGTKKDEAAAAGHMKKAAEKGLPLAQYSLGWFYHKGIGVDKDPLAAIRWYEKASKHGHLVADYQLAMMYMKGDETEKSCERAMRYFKKVAAKRHDEALECYDVKDDFAKKYCFSKESRKKNVSLCRTLMRESMFRVGSLYESGDPAQRDAEKARVWYKLAYDNGYSPAKEKLDLLNNE